MLASPVSSLFNIVAAAPPRRAFDFAPVFDRDDADDDDDADGDAAAADVAVVELFAIVVGILILLLLLPNPTYRPLPVASCNRFCLSADDLSVADG